MKHLKILMHQHNSVTVFVIISTFLVLFELFCMRMFVPSSVNANEMESNILMEQMCTTDQMKETSREIHGWTSQTHRLCKRLSSNYLQWQKELTVFHAFGPTAIINNEIVNSVNDRGQFVEAANYAADYLSLQSVMMGRVPLANISGNVYREGDIISIRDGEIQMKIIVIGSTYAIIQLKENDQDGDTQRTIYIANTEKYASGERMP
jgi:hypothetical protein